MDINNLHTFVTVAETGSFSQTSEQLFLTQPAISKRIAALESELNTALFDRIGRQVRLTEAGAALLPRARNILLEVEDSRRAISNLAGNIMGRLSIGTSHHIGLHRLPPVLRRYTKLYPQVELDLHFMDSEEACRAIEHGDLEMGIVTLPLHPLPQLEVQTVWPDPLRVVANTSHPLTKTDISLITELTAHAAILPAHGTYTREVIERALEPSGLRLKISMETNYLETIKMMVKVGLGWSILPESMIDKDLRIISIKDIALHRELGIVRHGGHTLSNAASAMISILSET